MHKSENQVSEPPKSDTRVYSEGFYLFRKKLDTRGYGKQLFDKSAQMRTMSSGEGWSYLIPNVGENIFTYFVNILKRSSVTVWKLVTVRTFYHDISLKNATEKF